MKQKWPGLLTNGVILMHDNARPHTAGTVKWSLDNFKWIVFPHPPYSPDLAPSDYYLFPDLKCHLDGLRFATTDELQNAIASFFRNLGTSWYALGIGKLIQRYNKCLDNGGIMSKNRLFFPLSSVIFRDFLRYF